MKRALSPLLALAALLLLAACGGGDDSLTLADLDPQQMLISVGDPPGGPANLQQINDATGYELLLPTRLPDDAVFAEILVQLPDFGISFEERQTGRYTVVLMSFEVGDRGFTIEQSAEDSATEQSGEPVDIDGYEGVLVSSADDDGIAFAWYVEDCNRTVKVRGAVGDSDMLLDVAESMQDECA